MGSGGEGIKGLNGFVELRILCCCFFFIFIYWVVFLWIGVINIVFLLKLVIFINVLYEGEWKLRIGMLIFLMRYVKRIVLLD